MPANRLSRLMPARLCLPAFLSAAGLFLAAAGPTTPAPGPVQIIGNSGGGCIQGAVRLPDDAPGLQTVRVGKSNFWGHPDTIDRLLQLARTASAAGLPDLYMGDLSNPRGGPMPGGHVSHQMGIDADVYLDINPHPRLPVAARENLEPPSLVRPDGRAVDQSRWRPEHATLLRMATQLPGVDRVLVNAAIKKQLCTTVSGERGWLRMIRPWYGHASHMHISFLCPAGQAECPPRPAPPPPGDGCDASLQWWFDRLDAPPKPAPPVTKPPRPPALPAACIAMLKAP
ncbi:MAG: penicillin-insensitive murein endopeptidase [Alphaproteobacteria bacterium]|nr:penicillin-insensitive murein endopeptidase [Alphaproteobacteria bacterium]